jgi:hypothetical protein
MGAGAVASANGPRCAVGAGIIIPSGDTFAVGAPTTGPLGHAYEDRSTALIVRRLDASPCTVAGILAVDVALCHQLRDRLSVDVSQSAVDAVVAEDQLRVVDAEQASQTVNVKGLWSRPAPPSVQGMRPSSVVHITIVSFSIPRRFRSLSSPATGSRTHPGRYRDMDAPGPQALRGAACGG